MLTCVCNHTLTHWSKTSKEASRCQGVEQVPYEERPREPGLLSLQRKRLCREGRQALGQVAWDVTKLSTLKAFKAQVRAWECGFSRLCPERRVSPSEVLLPLITASPWSIGEDLAFGYHFIFTFPTNTGLKRSTLKLWPNGIKQPLHNFHLLQCLKYYSKH